MECGHLKFIDSHHRPAVECPHMRSRAGVLAVVLFVLAAGCEESSVPRLSASITPTPEDLYRAYSTGLTELDAALTDLEEVRAKALSRLDDAPVAILNATREARNCDTPIDDLTHDPRGALSDVLGVLADPQLQSARDAPRGVAHDLAASHVASPDDRDAVEKLNRASMGAQIAGDPTPDDPVFQAYLDYLRSDPAFQKYLDDYDNFYDAYLSVEDKLRAAHFDFVQGLIRAPEVSNCSRLRPRSAAMRFRWVQGGRRTWHCGAHTLIKSQETCSVSGLATARQIGADYPFDEHEARRMFNYYGSIMYGWRFRKA